MIDEDPEYQTIEETYHLSESLSQNKPYSVENYSSVSMPSLKQQVAPNDQTKLSNLMPSSSSHHLFSTQLNTSFEQPLLYDKKSKKHHDHRKRPAKMCISTLSSSSAALPAMPSTCDTLCQHYNLSHYSRLLPLATPFNPTSMLIPPPPNFRNSAAFDESDLSLETKPIQPTSQPKRAKSKCSQKRKDYGNKITTQAIINYSQEEEPTSPSTQIAVTPFSSADNLPWQSNTFKRWYSR